MERREKIRLVRYDIPELDRHLLFNPASASIVVTDTLGASLIEAYLKGEAGDETFIESVRSRGLFEIPDDTDYGVVPNRLIIELTSACNLRCKTCYMAAATALEDELSTEEIKQLLSEAAQAGTKSVALMGGEPFLRKDIGEIVKFALARFSDVQVSTNGTILDEGFFRSLKGTSNLTIQVSLDGADPRSNDAIRGKGAFERASRLLDRAHAAGLKTAISGVLNSLNYNLVGKMCDFAYDKHARMAIFHKVHVVGRAESFPEILPSKQELMHGMGILLNKFHEYEISGKM
ncbi:MAG TPA: radical SAM protein, partial [Firmicutes bacterium]|nr:radical SAM protein [Bacillota bacterium]